MISSRIGKHSLRNDPTALRVEFKNDSIVVDLSDARTISVPVAWYDGLWEADDEELVKCRVEGGGNFICWPTLHQMLPVKWIVEGRHYVRPEGYVDPVISGQDKA